MRRLSVDSSDSAGVPRGSFSTTVLSPYSAMGKEKPSPTSEVANGKFTRSPQQRALGSCTPVSPAARFRGTEMPKKSSLIPMVKKLTELGTPMEEVVEIIEQHFKEREELVEETVGNRVAGSVEKQALSAALDRERKKVETLQNKLNTLSLRHGYARNMAQQSSESHFNARANPPPPPVATLAVPRATLTFEGSVTDASFNSPLARPSLAPQPAAALVVGGKRFAPPPGHILVPIPNETTDVSSDQLTLVELRCFNEQLQKQLDSLRDELAQSRILRSRIEKQRTDLLAKNALLNKQLMYFQDEMSRMQVELTASKEVEEQLQKTIALDRQRHDERLEEMRDKLKITSKLTKDRSDTYEKKIQALLEEIDAMKLAAIQKEKQVKEFMTQFKATEEATQKELIESQMSPLRAALQEALARADQAERELAEMAEETGNLGGVGSRKFSKKGSNFGANRRRSSSHHLILPLRNEKEEPQPPHQNVVGWAEEMVDEEETGNVGSGEEEQQQQLPPAVPPEEETLLIPLDDEEAKAVERRVQKLFGIKEQPLHTRRVVAVSGNDPLRRFEREMSKKKAQNKKKQSEGKNHEQQATAPSGVQILLPNLP